MAPAKKSGSKPTASARDRRSSSRQSTPLSAISDPPAAPLTPQPATPTSAAPAAGVDSAMPKETAYIHTATSALVSNDSSIEALIEKASSNGGAGANPPSARELLALYDRIKDSVNKFMGRRGEVCDRSMRMLAQKRKTNLARDRELEVARAAEERKAKKASKAGEKRSHEEMEVDTPVSAGPGGEVKKEKEDGVSGGEEERKVDNLPTVGAHGVARQDGVGVHQGAPPPPSPKIEPGIPSIDPMDTAASPSDSETSPTDPPSALPLYERAFGKDPTQFDDPTIYDIRDIRDDMTLAEKKEILNVAQWPDTDLKDLTAGEPPDMDFSIAKPPNQVGFATFQAYVEPYIRPFTEEDVAVLKERGDRFTPYVIPSRGSRGYKEVWASEDGMDGVAPPRKNLADPNEARGSMEDMNDDTAETDEVSMGPVMSRLMEVIRPTPNTNTAKKEASKNDEDADGDASIINGIDATTFETQDSQQNQAGAPSAEEQKPLTALPYDAPRPLNILPLDYETIETRAIQELRHIGFLSPSDIPDFATHNDDEVAARLRTLQSELRRISRANNIRRARVLELTEERMAMQEYSTIADDLDNQVNAAYLKRNRTLTKSAAGSKNKAGRPPATAKGFVAGGSRGVSDGVRALMQKRRDWVEMVGPVVGFGRPPIPGDGETVFDEAGLRVWERGEREAEMGEGEGD